MWDKDDHFGRWVQLICAFPLLLAGCAFLYLSFADFYSYHYVALACGSGLACLFLGSRCLWYAVTGKNNVNNDL